MSIEKSIIDRIKILISKGMPLSPAGKKGYGLTFDEEQATAGWLASAGHAVEMIFGSSITPYTSYYGKVSAKFSMASVNKRDSSQIKSECVGEIISVLQKILEDIEAGVIVSLENRVRGEIFDDFLDHAEEYHRRGRKESGVIAGVVFEDTIRRIASNNGVALGHLESTINELVKKGVITGTKAKRAKAAAHLRTKATHAEWDQFDLKDVGDAVSFTRELIATHLHG
jgi:hypothetical protein